MAGGRGFTLLELLMVVIIIAVLASIALPQYFRVTERARTGEALQVLATIRGSQLRFRAQNASDEYDNSAGMTGLDMTAPTMSAWGAPAVRGAGAGADICTGRNVGTWAGHDLVMDLDTGRVCAQTAAAGSDWGVQATAGCGGC